MARGWAPPWHGSFSVVVRRQQPSYGCRLVRPPLTGAVSTWCCRYCRYCRRYCRYCLQEELLRQRMRGKGTQLAEMILAPIYANLPSEMQVGTDLRAHGLRLGCIHVVGVQVQQQALGCSSHSRGAHPVDLPCNWLAAALPAAARRPRSLSRRPPGRAR